MEITILVVDDENHITEYLDEELTDHYPNFKILTCNSGYSALEAINSGKVNLLLTDIAMPDLDGYELFSRAKQLFPELPVIMMTGFGYDPNHVVVKSRQGGLKDVIFKPFDLNKLFALINLRLKSAGYDI